jgi:hypothetical protein
VNDLGVGIEHSCSSRRHRHLSRAKVDQMVRDGELRYLGKHKRMATYLKPKILKRVYSKHDAQGLYASHSAVREFPDGPRVVRIYDLKLRGISEPVRVLGKGYKSVQLVNGGGAS